MNYKSNPMNWGNPEICPIFFYENGEPMGLDAVMSEKKKEQQQQKIYGGVSCSSRKALKTLIARSGKEKP